MTPAITLTTGRTPVGPPVDSTPTPVSTAAVSSRSTGHQDTLATPAVGPGRSGRGPARLRRHRALAVVAGLVIVLGCTVVLAASAQPTAAAPRPAQPADPCAGPGPYPVLCPPLSTSPTSTAVPPNPCLTPQPGEPVPPWCLARPTTTSSPPTTATSAPPVGSTDGECGIFNPAACIGEGIAGFLHVMVGESLNILLSWVGGSLLSTPTLADLPRVGEIWEQSRLFAVAVYSLLVVLAGIVLMGHQSVQTRYSVREIAPRVVVGFLAANLSLPIGDQAIQLANTATLAVLGGSLDPQTAGEAVTELFVALVADSLVTGGLFTGALSLVLTVLLVALIVGYVVRVGLTVILLAGAPLALMCHGLPQTEGLARWFWRAGAGVLGIQVGQSLTLICALKVFLEPGGFRFFGVPTEDGLVNLVVLISLVWILVKIPSWVMRQVRIGGGHRSFVGGLARAFVFGKAMGLLGGRRGGTASTAGGAGHGARTPHGRDPQWPPPVREWGGIDGPFTPEAVARRLHTRHAQESARRRTVSGQQHLRFLQPTPQAPTHDLATWNPAGSTTTPEFRAATAAGGSAADTSSPLPRPAGTPAAPVFRAAGEEAGGRSTAPSRMRTAPVPAELRFRPATTDPPAPPVRAITGVQPPVFRPVTPEAGAHGRRARTHTPPPVLFRPPRLTDTAPPPAAAATRDVPPVRRPREGGERS